MDISPAQVHPHAVPTFLKETDIHDHKRAEEEARSLISVVDDDESGRLIEEDAVECLNKPFSDSDLLEALNSALRHS